MSRITTEGLRTTGDGSQAPASGAGRRTAPHALVLVVLAGSLGLKLLLAWYTAEMKCFFDECDYIRLASRIAAGHGLQQMHGFVWPPGFPYFLAACERLFGPARFAPVVLQVLASTVTVFVVYRIACRVYDRRAGAVSAALCAFYPNLVAFSHYLWPATLYILMLALAVWSLVARPETTVPSAALGGLCLGIAAFFKSTGLYFAPLAAGWLIASGAGIAGLGRRALLAAALVGATIVPVLPWTIHNWVSYDRFLLLDATAGRNLHNGMNQPRPANWDLGMGARCHSVVLRGGRATCTDANVVDRNRCEIRRALAFVRSHPRLVLARIPMKMADLLTPTSFLIRHVINGVYPYRWTPGEASALSLAASVAWMGVAAFGLAGLVLVPGARGRGLILALLAYYLAVHSITFGISRFRLPLTPFLIIGAGALLTRRRRELDRGRRNWRFLVAAAATGLLLALWWARLQTVMAFFVGVGG